MSDEPQVGTRERYDRLLQERRAVRPWHQFSLETLLIVMTLFCATLGWIGSGVRRQARQAREALNEREKRGAPLAMPPAGYEILP